MMTRNDFELLANALKSERTRLENAFTPEYSYDRAVNAVTEVCAAVNSRFDKKRFKRACGVQL